jgi:hypothetical protein
MDMDAENNKIGGNNLINKCDIIASNCLNIPWGADLSYTPLP